MPMELQTCKQRFKIGAENESCKYDTSFIKAVFTLPNGQELRGYLVGTSSFYAFGLFVGKREFLFNRNSPASVRKQIAELSKHFEDSDFKLFPLCYRSENQLLDDKPMQGIIEAI